MCKFDERRGEYGLWEDECYFCGHFETFGFSEHYHFCPNCAAIYTFPILHDSECNHVQDDTPYVSHEPMRGYRKKVYVIKRRLPHKDEPEQMCSKCGAWCLMDGW